MILISLYAGLANRMRALASALVLSEQVRQQLFVLWELGNALDCRFSDLFRPIESISAVWNIRVHDRMNRMLRRLYPLFFRLVEQDEVASYLNQPQEFLAMAERGRLMMRTYSLFFPVHDRTFDLFRPVPELQQAIDRLSSDFNENMVGVHIRRGDNKKSIEHSPTALFEDYMQTRIAANHRTRFFLATDSLDDERYLKARFADHIVSRPKRSYERNNPDAIRDALVDLYCLSRCRLIYGSHWSSFSEVAALIGKSELIVARC